MLVRKHYNYTLTFPFKPTLQWCWGAVYRLLKPNATQWNMRATYLLRSWPRTRRSVASQLGACLPGRAPYSRRKGIQSIGRRMTWVTGQCTPSLRRPSVDPLSVLRKLQVSQMARDLSPSSLLQRANRHYLLCASCKMGITAGWFICRFPLYIVR